MLNEWQDHYTGLVWFGVRDAKTGPVVCVLVQSQGSGQFMGSQMNKYEETNHKKEFSP